jgi:hypothetical protein
MRNLELKRSPLDRVVPTLFFSRVPQTGLPPVEGIYGRPKNIISNQSLALMDAGIAIKEHIAGVLMISCRSIKF